CGFIVDTIVGDGASENRTTFTTLADVSAREVFEPHFPSEILDALPTKMNIAFRHPNPHYNDILIFIGGEMPHWVKKFRNAMDSKKRELTFKGVEFSLSRLHDIFKKMGDTNVRGRCGVRRYKFGKEHFVLNSYNKMRVFLAVQIPSQTMIKMIRDFCNEQEDEDIDELVDIINATRVKNGKNLNVGFIDKPDHRHIYELFSILQLFEEWREDTEGFTHEFITRQTWMDLCWMVFGMAGVACTYLKKDGSRQIHQGRSGSDVCEHFFAKIR
ncbi:hypothetical protein ACHAXR_000576, partial [Thalassiosira sp. AJA248-18]